jgi:hypothetical protein
VKAGHAQLVARLLGEGRDAVGNVAVSGELEAAGQRTLLLDKREANRAARGFAAGQGGALRSGADRGLYHRARAGRDVNEGAM